VIRCNGEVVTKEGDEGVVAKLLLSEESKTMAVVQVDEEEKKEHVQGKQENAGTLDRIRRRYSRDGVYVHLCGGCNRVG